MPPEKIPNPRKNFLGEIVEVFLDFNRSLTVFQENLYVLKLETSITMVLLSLLDLDTNLGTLLPQIALEDISLRLQTGRSFIDMLFGRICELNRFGSIINPMYNAFQWNATKNELLIIQIELTNIFKRLWVICRDYSIKLVIRLEFSCHPE